MEQELKEALAKELQTFKESLPKMEDLESSQKAFTEFKTDIEERFDGVVKSSELKELQDIVEKQGEILQEQKLNSQKNVSFVDTLKSQLADFEEVSKNLADGRALRFETSRKAVTASNFTDSTVAFRENEVNEIPRGMPYIADFLPTVRLGNNTGGAVRWFEEDVITDNSEMVAEGTSSTTASNLTWAEKSLTGKRIRDFVKISKDQLKDIAVVNGAIRRLVEVNMKLKENTQLLSGNGTGNNLTGFSEYAQAFATAGLSVDGANLIDLIGKAKTQILVDMLGAAYPTQVFLNPADIDKIRYAKTDFGQYLFPNLIESRNMTAAGVQVVENPLVTANSLLMGDFSLSTLYVWDDLTIEIKEIEDDALKGLVTIYAYKRENLVVRGNDEKAFVKTANISGDITTITAGA